jgi:hypothetical protein
MWPKTQKFKVHFNHPELGSRASLFIAGDLGSYYNAIIVLNYLPHQ